MRTLQFQLAVIESRIESGEAVLPLTVIGTYGSNQCVATVVHTAKAIPSLVPSMNVALLEPEPPDMDNTLNMLSKPKPHPNDSPRHGQHASQTPSPEPHRRSTGAVALGSDADKGAPLGSQPRLTARCISRVVSQASSPLARACHCSTTLRRPR